MRCLFLKRASIFGALFFLALPIQGAIPCQPDGILDWQKISHLHDGDSLTLSDHRKIRLIGVNTPELARDNRPNEPFAKAARNFVKKRISESGGHIGLIYDEQRKDHYGRTLAHVYLRDMSNLTKLILAKGLGSHIAIAPNLRFNNCYSNAQKMARADRQGYWQNDNPSHDLDRKTKLMGGFQHVRGTITRIGQGPKNVWLNFGSKLALRIARTDLKYFTQRQPEDLLQSRIETSGWVYSAKGQKRMRIYHPSVIHEIDQ